MKKMVDGVVFNMTASELVAHEANQFIDSKDRKRREIEKERDISRFANVTALGHVWQADIVTQQTLASAILLAQAGAYKPSVWRDANNVDVPVTLADLVTIAGMMAEQTQMAYSTSWIRKANLNTAKTTKDIESV